MPVNTPPSASTLRALAVAADCDPRTVLKVWRGAPARTIAGRRAKQVLQAAGLLPVAPHPDSDRGQT